ncbi:MAG: hypothetical protein V3W44_10815 [Dehalococcoidales bacterium]
MRDPETNRRINTMILGLVAWMCAILILAFTAPGCNPYSAAWRTMDGLIKARNLTAQQLANVARIKHQDCKRQHGVKTAGFAECIHSTRGMLDAWQKQARPAINSALQITATSIQIAEQVKAEKKVDWLKLLKPAACALFRIAKSWGHYLPDKGQSALLAIGPFGELLCPN